MKKIFFVFSILFCSASINCSQIPPKNSSAPKLVNEMTREDERGKLVLGIYCKGAATAYSALFGFASVLVDEWSLHPCVRASACAGLCCISVACAKSACSDCKKIKKYYKNKNK